MAKTKVVIDCNTGAEVVVDLSLEELAKLPW